jgi:hypothetical protein
MKLLLLISKKSSLFVNYNYVRDIQDMSIEQYQRKTAKFFFQKLIFKLWYEYVLQKPKGEDYCKIWNQVFIQFSKNEVHCKIEVKM